MKPFPKIIAQRLVLFGLPALGIWAGLQKFSGRPSKPRLVEATLFAAAMSAYFASVLNGASKLGFPKLMTRIAPALGFGSIALTFDGGPCLDTTPRILDALSEAGAKATFFVLLDQVAKHPELVRRISAEGHTVGLQGKDDEPIALTSIRQIVHSLKMMQRELGDDLPMPRYFRPPRGYKSRNIQEAVDRMGMTLVTWSVNSNDLRAASPDTITARVIKHANNGDIVLLHDCVPLTADALPSILQRLKGRGFRLTRL